MAKSSAINMNLPSADDLFSTQEERDEAKRESVKDIRCKKKSVIFPIIRFRFVGMKKCLKWQKVSAGMAC